MGAKAPKRHTLLGCRLSFHDEITDLAAREDLVVPLVAQGSPRSPLTLISYDAEMWKAGTSSCPDPMAFCKEFW